MILTLCLLTGMLPVRSYADQPPQETLTADMTETAETTEAAEETTEAVESTAESTSAAEETTEAAVETTQAAQETTEAAEEAMESTEEAAQPTEETLPPEDSSPPSIREVYQQTGEYLEGLAVPEVGAMNGEWRVIGLARSGRTVSSGYYDNVSAYVSKKILTTERLHKSKSTENSRVIVALTAMGYDVTDVAGHDLLAGLNEMKYLRRQGINGPIWALIAFDSHDYQIPSGDVTREALLEEILDAQIQGGGWSLSKSSDPDLTGMAIQALAPYYGSSARVTAAVDTALAYLSAAQNSRGGYSSAGAENSESAAQVIVALTTLGIDPHTDSRFIKDGSSVVDALCSYAVSGGGFAHIPGGERNTMATEQGYYALTAWHRLQEGKTSLYDMSDVTIRDNIPEETTEAAEESSEPPEETTKPTEPVKTEKTIKVTFSILGDKVHDSETDGKVHTLSGGGLTTWVKAKQYTVAKGSTVKAVLEKVLKENGMSCTNPSGNYVESITRSGITLGEFDNGGNSGWMYTLNGDHPNLGVQEQKLKNGDKIVFHYTDDYTQESGSEGYAQSAAEKVEALIDKIGASVTISSESKIKAARKAYDALTPAQKKQVSNYSDLTAAEFALAKRKATNEDKTAANKVSDMIVAIGHVTWNSGENVAQARRAYDALTDTQRLLVENYDLLVAAEALLDTLDTPGWETLYQQTGDYMESLGTPSVGAIGGEWMILGLARSGREVPEGYYSNVLSYLAENMDENQRLHKSKSTDNSRLILALSAMGQNTANVNGNNLLAGLTEMAYLEKQGINGPIWALIAFDSGNYPIPESGDVSRKVLLETILEAQLEDGGWTLSGDTADPDMTGMALQALAPYVKTSADAEAAALRGVETLSAMQDSDGGFSSIDGASSESSAQVIVALTALGIDPKTDPRFVKNGISVLDALCAYGVEGGGFRHIQAGELNGMATEQGYYALTAYARFLEGKMPLYNMTDVLDMGGDPVIRETTAPVETQKASVKEAQKARFPWYLVILILLAGSGVAALIPVVRKNGEDA